MIVAPLARRSAAAGVNAAAATSTAWRSSATAARTPAASLHTAPQDIYEAPAIPEPPPFPTSLTHTFAKENIERRPLPSTAPLNPATVRAQPIDPQRQYREKLRGLRRAWAAQTAERRAEDQQLREEREAKAQQEQLAFWERARLYHASKTGDAGAGITPPPTAASSDAATDASANAAKQPSVKAQWRAYIRERRKTRFVHALAVKQAEQEERLRHIIDLYHASANWVTYETLNQHIELAVGAHFPTPSVLQASDRPVAGPAGLRDADVPPLSLAREAALWDVLMGTARGSTTQPGLERVREFAAASASTSTPSDGSSSSA
ncbi:hypothetical protein CXG81DRAFT_17196 [Caulochytrium protostelioides]|uniref:Uncharacterized protein n=1 Tax=Caulochytrium protostelioides TaxID=1555241 RepID=A0A4P9XCT6_9FUNG|nr:hypothetical protein CXG81DRAFT_17196 [Caulochytrium protostelioides]|eukprot:RKP03242.1 hypothetical protein CXG81DRAFT_17196 [Caulochytrium protostelioides]